MNYPDEPTSLAQVDSTDFDSELLGENDLGSVHIHGPFGNLESNVKIAYLIGMHPLESKSHRALFDKLTSKKDLKYCYYVYNINVSNKTSPSEGRDEGQLLAQEFVAPHIIDEKYDLFLDIHSNRGANGPGDYRITNFVFAPGFDDRSTELMNAILADIPEIMYYAPEFRSSPPFITEPTSAAGIPTIVYECYSFEPIDVSYDLALKLINSVDGLSF
ncbi:adhesin [Methanobrevibacter sp.]|uniref:adhesin n=1 Tax=Methanobrevibacter sp. TaxID=66852 RepID=UPI003890BEC3